jgi:hypothetical protein
MEENEKLTPIEKEFLKEKKRIEDLINKEYAAFNNKFNPSGLSWYNLQPKMTPFRWELAVNCSRTNKLNNFPNINL